MAEATFRVISPSGLVIGVIDVDVLTEVSYQQCPSCSWVCLGGEEGRVCGDRFLVVSAFQVQHESTYHHCCDDIRERCVREFEIHLRHRVDIKLKAVAE